MARQNSFEDDQDQQDLQDDPNKVDDIQRAKSTNGTNGFNTPQGSYGSNNGAAGKYGSGLVNIGELFAQNRASAQRSSNTLNAGLSKQGDAAQGLLTGSQNRFNTAMNDGSVQSPYGERAAVPTGPGGVYGRQDLPPLLTPAKPLSDFNNISGPRNGPPTNPVSSRTAFEQANDPTKNDVKQFGLDTVGAWQQAQKFAGPYAGPTGLDLTDADRSAIDLAAQRSKALGSFEGTAGEVARQSGLGARQSAYEAMLMGASNPERKALSEKYGNLNQLMNQASSEARNRGSAAAAGWGDKQKAAEAELERSKTQFMNQTNQELSDAELEKARQHDRDMVNTSTNGSGETVQTYKDENQDPHQRSGGDEAHNMTSEDVAARYGISMEDWVAAGSPTSTEDLQKLAYRVHHPDPLTGKPYPNN